MTKAEVLAARKAFRAGGLWRHEQFLNGRGAGGLSDDEYTRVAEAKYPMPKKKKKIVLREVTTSTGTRCRVVGDLVQFITQYGSNWFDTPFTLDDYAAIASLKDNPTCEVEVTE